MQYNVNVKTTTVTSAAAKSEGLLAWLQLTDVKPEHPTGPLWQRITFALWAINEGELPRGSFTNFPRHKHANDPSCDNRRLGHRWWSRPFRHVGRATHQVALASNQQWQAGSRLDELIQYNVWVSLVNRRIAWMQYKLAFLRESRKYKSVTNKGLNQHLSSL